jgi:hypothetical protein
MNVAPLPRPASSCFVAAKLQHATIMSPSRCGRQLSVLQPELGYVHAVFGTSTNNTDLHPRNVARNLRCTGIVHHTATLP